jgi:hypothetical protein
MNNELLLGHQQSLHGHHLKRERFQTLLLVGIIALKI